MSDRASDLCCLLDAHGIGYQRQDHPAVFTCEEADELVPALPGARTKNLFLRDRKAQRHFLLSVPPEKMVDLKALGTLLGVSKLSMASPARLERYLGLTPGSVSLLGVVNDVAAAVEVVMDRELWRADAILCHPLVNTSTLVIARDNLERLFAISGNKFQVVDVPQRG